MRIILMVLLLFALPISAEPFKAVWDACSVRNNGVAIKSGELLGYELNYRLKATAGTSPAWIVVNVKPEVTSYTADLTLGEYEARVLCTDSNKLNSEWSPIVLIKVQDQRPKPPGNLRQG